MNTKMKLYDKKLLDMLRVRVEGGWGGNGYRKHRSPGGNGGDVYLTVSEGSKLSQLRKSLWKTRACGQTGAHSSQWNYVAEDGAPFILKCPPGVTVEYNGDVIGELVNSNDKILVAHGGKGGSAATNYIGQPGQVRYLKLSLKMLADVGLVGFPNAGKSTILTALTKARPLVASWQFSTLHPNVGVVEYSDGQQIKIADCPGLIEGASENRGLGHDFLKHVERTRILCMVVDVNGFQLGPDQPHRSAFETILLLNQELELYKEVLVEKPFMLAVNKMDSPNTKQKFAELMYQLKNSKEELRKYSKEWHPEQLVKIQSVVGLSAKYHSQSRENLRKAMYSFLQKYLTEKEIEYNEEIEDDEDYQEL